MKFKVIKENLAKRILTSKSAFENFRVTHGDNVAVRVLDFAEKNRIKITAALTSAAIAAAIMAPRVAMAEDAAAKAEESVDNSVKTEQVQETHTEKASASQPAKSSSQSTSSKSESVKTTSAPSASVSHSASKTSSVSNSSESKSSETVKKSESTSKSSATEKESSSKEETIKADSSSKEETTKSDSTSKEETTKADSTSKDETTKTDDSSKDDTVNDVDNTSKDDEKTTENDSKTDDVDIKQTGDNTYEVDGVTVDSETTPTTDSENTDENIKDTEDTTSKTEETTKTDNTVANGSNMGHTKEEDLIHIKNSTDLEVKDSYVVKTGKDDEDTMVVIKHKNNNVTFWTKNPTNASNLKSIVNDWNKKYPDRQISADDVYFEAGTKGLRNDLVVIDAGDGNYEFVSVGNQWATILGVTKEKIPDVNEDVPSYKPSEPTPTPDKPTPKPDEPTPTPDKPTPKPDEPTPNKPNPKPEVHVEKMVLKKAPVMKQTVQTPQPASSLPKTGDNDVAPFVVGAGVLAGAVYAATRRRKRENGEPEMNVGQSLWQAGIRPVAALSVPANASINGNMKVNRNQLGQVAVIDTVSAMQQKMNNYFTR